MTKKFAATFLVGLLALLVLPTQASAAQIYLTPPSGRFSVGDEFKVEILTDTQGKNINTAETNIVFSSNTLELLNVTQGSTFLLPTPGSKIVEGNTVYIGGGLPTPGFNGKSGVLGSLTFKAKAVGKATVTITRGRALSNDGVGSQLPVTTQSASFDVTLPPVNQVVVNSTSHPDQKAWSRDSNPNLTWVMPPNAYGVSFILDRNPDTNPDDTLDATTDTARSFQKLNDGIWYFHIKARGSQTNDPFGPVTHYKLQLDTVAPLPFPVKVEAESDLENTSVTPTITYNAIDDTSGVYRYDVYMDNRLVKELAPVPYVFSNQSTGQHGIKVVAYDRAGNSTVSELPINITLPGEQPVTFNYLRKFLLVPVYALLLINLLIVIAVAYLFHQRKKNTNIDYAVHKQMDKVQLAVERVAGFEAGMTKLRREMDMKFRQASEIRSQAATPTVPRPHTDVDRNVERLSQQINIWFNEFSHQHTKDEVAGLQKKLEQQLQAEIDRNIKLLNDVVNNRLAEIKSKQEQEEAYNEISSRLEILQKLQGQITDSRYTNWRGHTNNG